jgi:hypothetical protein
MVMGGEEGLRKQVMAMIKQREQPYLLGFSDTLFQSEHQT